MSDDLRIQQRPSAMPYVLGGGLVGGIFLIALFICLISLVEIVLLKALHIFYFRQSYS